MREAQITINDAKQTTRSANDNK